MTISHLYQNNLFYSHLVSCQKTFLTQKFKSISQSIPYYQAIMHEKQIDLDNDPFENLQKMPYLSAQDYYTLSECAWQVLKNQVYLIDSSSGSTGKPKRRFLTIKDEYLEIEQMYRIFGQAGFSQCRRLALLDVWFPNMYPLFVRAASLIGIPHVFSLGMGNNPLHTINNLIELDIDTIISIPTVIFNIFDTIVKERLENKIKNKIKKILFFGEQCPESWKNLIQDKLGIEIYLYYGSTELGCIGGDCKTHSGIHIFEDMFLIELCNSQEKNGLTQGELVLTTLQMDGTPLIRYRTMDIVSLDTIACSCGSPFKKINIIGRVDDMLSIYGSKYFIKQFDNIFIDILDYFPFYRLKLIPPIKGENNYYIMVFYLPLEVKKHEQEIHHRILKLESMKRYVKNGFLSISYQYLTKEIKNDSRKFRKR